MMPYFDIFDKAVVDVAHPQIVKLRKELAPKLRPINYQIKLTRKVLQDLIPLRLNSETFEKYEEEARVLVETKYKGRIGMMRLYELIYNVNVCYKNGDLDVYKDTELLKNILETKKEENPRAGIGVDGTGVQEYQKAERVKMMSNNYNEEKKAIVKAIEREANGQVAYGQGEMEETEKENKITVAVSKIRATFKWLINRENEMMKKLYDEGLIDCRPL